MSSQPTPIREVIPVVMGRILKQFVVNVLSNLEESSPEDILKALALYERMSEDETIGSL